LALRVQAGKRRQKRRVDVQHPVGERGKQGRTCQPHEPGQADDIHGARLENAHYGAIVRVSIRVLVGVQVHRFDPGRAGARQSAGVRTVRDNDRDLGIQPALCDGIDDRLEI
jgi:hypothetical protein